MDRSHRYTVDFKETQYGTEGNGSLPTLPSFFFQAFLQLHLQVSPEQSLKKKKNKTHFNGFNTSQQKWNSSFQSIIPKNMYPFKSCLHAYPPICASPLNPNQGPTPLVKGGKIGIHPALITIPTHSYSHFSISKLADVHLFGLWMEAQQSYKSRKQFIGTLSAGSTNMVFPSDWNMKISLCVCQCPSSRLPFNERL